jgi:hypothetical protein
LENITLNRQHNSHDLIDVEDNKSTSSLVPVVLLVVEGDLDTVKQGK